MEDKKAPKMFGVSWKLYDIYLNTPLKDIGVVGSSTTPFFQEPQVKQMEKIIMSGSRAVEIQTWGKQGGGSPISEEELRMIRDLAIATNTKVTVHGPTNIVGLSEDAAKAELMNAIRAAILVTTPEEKLKKENLYDLVKKSENMLVNIHLGTEGVRGGLGTELGRTYGEDICKAYTLAREDPNGRIRPLLEFFSPLDALESLTPSLADEIKKEYFNLKRKIEMGELSGRDIVEEKRKLREKLEKYLKYTFIVSAWKHNLLDIAREIERVKKEMGEAFKYIEKDFVQFFDAIKRGEKEEAKKILNKIIDKISESPYKTRVLRDALTSLREYLFLIDSIKRMGSPILRGNESEEDAKRKIDEAKKKFEKEVEEAFSKIIEKTEDKGLREMLYLQKEVFKELGKRVIDEHKVYPIPKVVSSEDFFIKRESEIIAKTLADCMIKYGFIPKFTIENEPAPAPSSDPEFLIKFVKETRKKFIEEVKKRKDLLKRKFGLTDEEVDKLAEEMAKRIGITFDTAHHWMWLAHGKTEEEVVEEMKKLFDSGYVLHIHAVDTLPDAGHHHLAPGHGIIDWETIKKVIEEKKKEGKIPEDICVMLEPQESITFMRGISQVYPSYVMTFTTYGVQPLSEYFQMTYGYTSLPFQFGGYSYFETGGYFFPTQMGGEGGGRGQSIQ